MTKKRAIFRRRTRGNAATELVLAAPVLVTLLAAAVDYGLAMRDVETLRAATRAAAELAITVPRDPTTKQFDGNAIHKITQVVYFSSNHDANVFRPTEVSEYYTATARGSTIEFGDRPVLPQVEQFCTCPGQPPSQNLAVCRQPTGPFCGDGQRATMSVKITASRSFQRFFPVAAPWLPDLEGSVLGALCPSGDDSCRKGATVSSEVRLD